MRFIGLLLTLAILAYTIHIYLGSMNIRTEPAAVQESRDVREIYGRSLQGPTPSYSGTINTTRQVTNKANQMLQQRTQQIETELVIT